MRRLLSYLLLFSLPVFLHVGPLIDGLHAGEPPREPILRIETGMHTAMIGRIGVDSENRILVTASNDKTVRVWETATGRLLRILRPPVGNGNEGKIYSVALSPDGKTVVCGGWTGGSWEESYCIYLFDRESGKIVRRIAGLPGVIHHLVFSHDAKYLMAGMSGSNGIRVYRSTDYSVAAEDEGYGDDCCGAAFDAEGRLVTVSIDGFIRIYDNNFKLVAKKKAPGGNQPFSANFCPDGSRVVVGFDDSTNIDILSGKDLSYLYSPDTKGITNGDLGSVAWASNGRSIYAGGSFGRNHITPVFKWADEGRGERSEHAAANDTITHILPGKDGGVLYGACGPAFGILDENGKRIFYESASTADYRGNRDRFLVSYSGAAVQFGCEISGKTTARYSVKNRALDFNPEGMPPEEQLSPPAVFHRGIEISDWKDGLAPKLNGAPLKLECGERCRGLAIDAGNERFILGTNWRLRLFDRSGEEKWSIAVPATVWGVNVSGSGELAVAAFGDGTIRWYRITDGKELLAFFPHNDRKRWVVWTPSGYYDAAPGADEIIGWHVNNGKDNAADYFPISKFRQTYYRPDVIAEVLNTLDENEAVRLADAESGRQRTESGIVQILPPVVEIVAPGNGAVFKETEVLVKFNVRSPSGEPVTSIRAMIDGRPVSAERGLSIVAKDSGTRELKVAIPEKDSQISIIAENRYAASAPATIAVKWGGNAVKDEFVIRPRLYALAIGVSRYANKELVLGLAAKDARDFAETMEKQKDGLYREVVTRVLADEKATKDEILDGLEWLQRETTSKDVAIVFLAGHGVNDAAGIYYFLPSNADTERLKRTGVAFSDIRNTVSSLPGKTIVFVDTCHSGNIMGARRGTADISGVVNELASAENGVVVFASSTGKQYSLEDQAWGNGAFTKALIEGIDGKADYTGKGKITINMLDLYLSERVKELTKGRQTPTTTKPQTIPDFPVAVSGK